MMQIPGDFSFIIDRSDTRYSFIADASQFEAFFAADKEVFFIVDDKVYQAFPDYFRNRNCISLPVSEQQKSMTTLEYLCARLLEADVHKTTMLVAVGGGVLTDLVAFLAAVFMRGVDLCLVPTTLLAMVDAAIGGKNGVNAGVYKNMLGTIRQPGALLYHLPFLRTLPEEEWQNGFAEIIKYACTLDAVLYTQLLSADINFYRDRNNEVLLPLIYRCICLKNEIVRQDEQDMGMRRVLNFGHTAGHAFENLYNLKHGHAVALGMIVALILSERIKHTNPTFRKEFQHLLQHFGLPVSLEFDPSSVMEILKKDKKREWERIYYVLLEEPGRAVVELLPLSVIEEALQQFAHECKYKSS